MSEQINISKRFIEGKCDLKCSYNFVYAVSNSNALNDGTSILVDYEKTSTAPVLYNKKKYFVQGMSLIYPSSLLYNNRIAEAEIRIAHIPENTGPSLVVVIPIKISSETSQASTIITSIINRVSMSAPSEGQKTNLGSFSLQKIVPSKPFFNFNIDDSKEGLAFTMLDAIPITSATLDRFKQIIRENTSKIEGDPSLYYNSLGPNTNTSVGDGIYISCNPTGNSTETTEVTYEKDDTNFDIGDIWDDPIFLTIVQVILSCVIFIIIFYVWNYGYMFIDGNFGTANIIVAAPKI